MSTMTSSAMNVSNSKAATSKKPGKGLNVALWIVQALLALQFAMAGSMKLLGNPDMVGLFEAIGLGQWFRYLTGVLELTCALLVLVPRARVIGAGLLVSVMIGAVATHLLVLHNAPTMPAVILVLAGFVLWGRRQELIDLVRRVTG